MPQVRNDCLKILFFVGFDVSLPQGHANHVRELVDALERRGHCVQMVCPEPSDPNVWSGPSGGLQTLRRRRLRWLGHLWLQWKFSRRVRAQIADFGPDVFLYRSESMNWVPIGPNPRGVVLCVETNASLSAHAHLAARSQLWSRLATRFERISLERADSVGAVSSRLADIQIQNYNLTRDRVVIIHNGTGLPTLDAEKATDLRRARGIRDSEFLIAFVGSLTPWQGLDEFIGQLPALRNDNFRLWIIGEGTVRPELEELVDQLGLGDKISFLGSMPEAEALRHSEAAQILVAPYNQSALLQLHGGPTLKIQQAMGCARPLLFTSLPEMEFIEEMGAGEGIDPRTKEGWAIAIRSWRTRWTEAGSALVDWPWKPQASPGRRWVQEERTWDQTAIAWETEMRRALDRPRPRASRVQGDATIVGDERADRRKLTEGYDRRMASGSLLNMMALAVMFLCGFFMTPFLLHELGPTKFSIFVLAQAFVGFLPLLTFGIPTSLSHLLSTKIATEDWNGLEKTFSNGLAFLAMAGGVALVVGGAVVFILPRFLEMDSDLIPTARWVFALLIVQAAVSFPLLAYRTVYQAAQSFAIPNLVRSIFVPLRMLTIYLMFVSGQAQLVVWAGVFAIAEVVEGSYLAVRTRSIVPQLRARLHSVSRSELRGLIHFSTWVFMGALGYLLYHNTDYLLIHWFIEPDQVAHYNLAARWDPILRGVVATVANPVIPIAAALWKANRKDEVREVFLRTTRYCMLLALPTCLLLAVFADLFLAAWAGPEHGQDGTVLVILMLPLIFTLAHGPAGSLYIGLGKTRVNGILTLGLAVVNVVLSLYFVRSLGWGLEGIALGTALTYFLRTGLLSPWYACRLIGLPLTQYVRSVLLRPGLAALPMVGVALALRFARQPDTLVEIALAMGASALIFAIFAWRLALSTRERAQVRVWVEGMRP